MFHDDENRALGMSYLNFFTICEDDQFECSGVFEVDSESIDNATFYCNIRLEQTTTNHSEANEDDRIQEPDSRIIHWILASAKLSLSTLAFDYLASNHLVTGYLNHLSGSVGMTSSLT